MASFTKGITAASVLKLLKKVDGDSSGIKAETSSRWSFKRLFNFGGSGSDVSGSAEVDGSENVTFNIQVEDDSHSHTSATLPDQLSLGDFNGTQGVLTLWGSVAGRYSTIKTTDGNQHIDVPEGNKIYLNYITGDGVNFGGGANNVVASVQKDGEIYTKNNKHWHAGIFRHNDYWLKSDFDKNDYWLKAEFNPNEYVSGQFFGQWASSNNQTLGSFGNSISNIEDRFAPKTVHTGQGYNPDWIFGTGLFHVYVNGVVPNAPFVIPVTISDVKTTQFVHCSDIADYEVSLMLTYDGFLTTMDIVGKNISSSTWVSYNAEKIVRLVAF